MNERDDDAEVALQYLTWALEHISKIGNHEAARHYHLALEALRKPQPAEPL